MNIIRSYSIDIIKLYGSLSSILPKQLKMHTNLIQNFKCLFLLNNVVIATNKPNMKRNKLVVLYSSDFPPLNSCERQTSFKYLFYIRFDRFN